MYFLTLKEEQLSVMVKSTNQVKQTKSHPHTRDAGWAYCRLLTYNSVIFVKTVIIEKEMDSVLNMVIPPEILFVAELVEGLLAESTTSPSAMAKPPTSS